MFGADWDGVIASSWRIEGDQLVRRQHQPSQDAILNFNAELRKNPGSVEHASFMGMELNIPEVDYYRLRREFPGIASQDAHERTATWKMLLKTDVLDPYRVRDRVKVRGL